MKLKNSNFHKELERAFLADNEQKAREIIIRNFQKFPKEMQRTIALVLLEEGLNKELKQKIKEYHKKATGTLDLYKATVKKIKTKEGPTAE